jgi:hypothetical protein
LKPGGVVANGALNIASRDSRATVEAGGLLQVTALTVAPGSTLAIGLANEPPIVAQSAVAFQRGVVIAPLNPENLAGTFPLLSAAEIRGVENLRLDLPAAPNARLQLNADATVLRLVLQ